MATFTNFATLSYNGNTINSNTVTGEILDSITATKTAVVDRYNAADTITYVVSLINSDSAAATLTLTDDLGGYDVGGTTVYPLALTDNSVQYYVNGILQATPTVTDGPPLVISGINVPAGGNALVIYEATTTAFAPLGAGATIDNTVTVTGTGVTAPVTATETVTAAEGAALTISKALSPAVVTENGQITYTFVMENSGNTAINTTDNAVLTDTFDPILTNIAVTYNGTPWTEGVNYSYDEATGVFTTLPAQIAIPAATYTQAPDGRWIIDPGTATLVISGTI